MALLSAGLGILVVSGAAQLWHVYGFALLLGVVSALDAPVRQTFVSELVRDDYLPNAVALNSASFNVARMIGPAVAGVLTVAVGPGWVFLINTLTFVALLLSLGRFPPRRCGGCPGRAAGKGRIREGLRYVRFRPDIVVVLVAVFIVGTLGLNFVLFIAAMVGTEFGLDAGAFGLMNSIMAIGSVAGALLSAGRRKPRLRIIFGAAGAFGVTSGIAALAPGLLLVRRRAGAGGPLRDHHDDQRQRVRPDDHGPGDARPGDGPLHGHLHGRHPHRGAPRGLGGQRRRPPLVDGRRGGRPACSRP